MDKWIEMIITCKKDFLSHLTTLLMSRKIMKWAEEDDENNVRLKLYFPFYEELGENIESLRKFLDVESVNIVTREIDDEDWATSWQRFFQVEKVGERVIIKPPWREYSRVNNEIIIEIEPRAAFGSGFHPTTKLTLMLEEKYLQPGMDVLDMGCGSGILTILAIQMDVNKVVAADCDEIAVKETRRNLLLADLGEKGFNTSVITILSDGFREITEKFDLVMVNILTEFLLQNMAQIAGSLKPGGILITGSIEEGKTGNILELAKREGLFQIDRIEMNGWTGLAFKLGST